MEWLSLTAKILLLLLNLWPCIKRDSGLYDRRIISDSAFKNIGPIIVDEIKTLTMKLHVDLET